MLFFFLSLARGVSNSVRVFYPPRSPGLGRTRPEGLRAASTTDSASCLASSELRVHRPSESVVEAVR